MIGIPTVDSPQISIEAFTLMEALDPKEFVALTATIAGVAQNLRRDYPSCKTLKVLAHIDDISDPIKLTEKVERLMSIAAQGRAEEDFLQKVLIDLELAYYRFAQENPQIIGILGARPEIAQLLPQVFAGFVPFLAGKIDETIQDPENSFKGTSPFQKVVVHQDGKTYTSNNLGWFPCF